MFRSFFLSREWFIWAYIGTALILFTSWYMVELLVEFNKWQGGFFNLVEEALSNPGQMERSDFYSRLGDYGRIAGEYIVLAVLLDFFTSHYVFRWRTAMNGYYMSRWQELRRIEGAAQRVQEDTMKFAEIMEDLGSKLLRSILTLFAFLPLLWGLSENITELPLIGPVDRSMVWLAIFSAAFGTGLVALAAIRLPGLHFENQKVEAAYRKELCYGEDYKDRSSPVTCRELFSDVRRNYFRIYWHYCYFNFARYSYLQASDVFILVMMVPTLVVGIIKLGVFYQILNAFGRVEGSFQYLVNSWSRIVELLSIHKRLKHFEMAIDDKSRSQTMPPLYPGEGGSN